MQNASKVHNDTCSNSRPTSSLSRRPGEGARRVLRSRRSRPGGRPSTPCACPRPLGSYAVEWEPTEWRDEVLGRLGGTFHGTVMEFKPGREFFLADMYWLPPDGDPIGPMALEVTCSRHAWRHAAPCPAVRIRGRRAMAAVLRRRLDPAGTARSKRSRSSRGGADRAEVHETRSDPLQLQEVRRPWREIRRDADDARSPSRRTNALLDERPRRCA